jgi:hypothetical protein
MNDLKENIIKQNIKKIAEQNKINIKILHDLDYKLCLHNKILKATSNSYLINNFTIKKTYIHRRIEIVINLNHGKCM